MHSCIVYILDLFQKVILSKNLNSNSFLQNKPMLCAFALLKWPLKTNLFSLKYLRVMITTFGSNLTLSSTLSFAIDDFLCFTFSNLSNIYIYPKNKSGWSKNKKLNDVAKLFSIHFCGPNIYKGLLGIPVQNFY